MASYNPSSREMGPGEKLQAIRTKLNNLQPVPPGLPVLVDRISRLAMGENLSTVRPHSAQGSPMRKRLCPKAGKSIFANYMLQRRVAPLCAPPCGC